MFCLCPLYSKVKQLYVYITLALVALSCPALCDPMDCRPPGSSVHGILQARILEWVAISFSLCIHISPLFGFPSLSGHHRALTEFPELYNTFSLVISFMLSINSVCISILISQFIPHPCSPPGVHVFVLYTWAKGIFRKVSHYIISCTPFSFFPYLHYFMWFYHPVQLFTVLLPDLSVFNGIPAVAYYRINELILPSFSHFCCIISIVS